MREHSRDGVAPPRRRLLPFSRPRRYRGGMNDVEDRLAALESDARDLASLVLSALSRVEETLRLTAIAVRPEATQGLSDAQVRYGVSLTTAEALLEDVRRLLSASPDSRVLLGSLAALERRLADLREQGPGAATGSQPTGLAPVIELFPRRR